MQFDDAFDALERMGLSTWSQLRALVANRTRSEAHGDLAGWLKAIAALDALPLSACGDPNLNQPSVASGEHNWTDDQRAVAERSLKALIPWRKGPFKLGGIVVDSEWRSDLKFSRLEPALGDLSQQRILDVGCGNGYYALRMLGCGARSVIGVDPVLLAVVQFLAARRFLGSLDAHVLPLRLEDLPAANAFDTVLSAGVLYHSRTPIDHLTRLRDMLRPGGKLVLETLILPGDDALSRTPNTRYARMRNVWHLPTLAELLVWLARLGFREPAHHDSTVTTVEEQRSTEWMPFESLEAALDPDNSDRTVEGWPRPLRAVVSAHRPG